MKKVISLLSLFATLTVFGGNNPADSKSFFLVDDFNEGIQNRLGGYYNKFESGASTSSTFPSYDIFHGEGGRSLKVHAVQKPGGFCGVWMHLFDFRAEQKKYFDSRNYSFLSFWVKGEKGGEDFIVKMADETWIGKEDSVPLGNIKQYLPGGVTKEWQEVLVPLNEIQTLDRMSMGGITLDFTNPGDYTIYIDDVAFKTSAKIPTPLSPKSASANEKLPSYPRALWVWDTEPLLMNLNERKKFFEFCKEQNIDAIWLQLLYSLNPEVDVSRPPWDQEIPKTSKGSIASAEKFREFNHEAHQAGLKIHTLEGYPEFVQKEFHIQPLTAVDAVIEFNKESKPEERFDGIHYDNEPYLLIGWRDWSRREEILKEFLDLVSECQKRVRQQPGLVFGVDIPFWWHDKDERAGKINGMVTFNGVRKPADYHCIDLLDNVGIMDYRNTADGADGLIAHGRELLEYGDKVKKAAIYIGVETFAYQPTEVWLSVGLPRKNFEEALRGKAKDYCYLSRIERFRTQVFDDGNNLHVGIELPVKPTPEQEKKINKVMVEIAKRFNPVAYPELKSKADAIRADAEFGLSSDPEWTNPRTRTIKDPETGIEYPGVVATSIMLPKTTFAGSNYEDIKFQLKTAEDYFRKYRSYAGIAIHFYNTYRQKVEESQKNTPQKP